MWENLQAGRPVFSNGDSKQISSIIDISGTGRPGSSLRTTL